MVRLEIRQSAKAKGIENANQLAVALECSLNTAYGLWREEIFRIEFETLDKLCDLFDCDVSGILIRGGKHGKKNKGRK